MIQSAKTGRITECETCHYRAITWSKEECSKCGGKLEIIASEDLTDFHRK